MSSSGRSLENLMFYLVRTWARSHRQCWWEDLAISKIGVGIWIATSVSRSYEHTPVLMLSFPSDVLCILVDFPASASARSINFFTSRLGMYSSLRILKQLSFCNLLPIIPPLSSIL